MTFWSTGEKKSGRQRDVTGGMSALWFVVEKINRQVVLARSIILRRACWASFVSA
jgi:hypothetical protein